MITQLGALDEILSVHAGSLGDDFVPYRNHVYRIVTLSLRLHSPSDELRRLAIAAAFHDLGIWTAGTFDYLAPFGVARRFIAELYSAWPSAGFHRRLVQLTLQRVRSNPWTPLPMVRL